ncbi:MAG: tyrosine-type recombinase/integrase [Rhodobacteraceae bacterium]|nr:tyrosine-type recombinase/integrase [Paracoccaceae bacterium]
MGKLTANILNTASVGKHSDGAGLYLLVTGHSAKGRAKGSWIFRYTYLKQRYEMGLGSIQSLSLARARSECDRWRDLMNDRRNPVNPMDEKRRMENDALHGRAALTLAEIAPLAFEAIKGRLKGDGKAGRWYSPLRLYVLPALGNLKVEEIHQRDIERAFRPIWHSKAPTAKKALHRLGSVLNHAAAMGLEVNSNAVLNAKQLLGEQRHKVQNHPALPWEEVPKLYQWLRPEITTQRALMLYILTGGGSRIGPLRRARRDQFSGDVWTIEGEELKGRRDNADELRVPVTREMRRIVEWPASENDGDFLFPSPRSRPNRPMAITDQAIENIMRDREIAWEWAKAYRPHGLRSSFRSWVSEVDPSLFAVAETALAHRVGGITERTYAKNDFLEQRRSLMERWADHLTGGTGEVVRFAAK